MLSKSPEPSVSSRSPSPSSKPQHVDELWLPPGVAWPPPSWHHRKVRRNILLRGLLVGFLFTALAVGIGVPAFAVLSGGLGLRSALFGVAGVLAFFAVCAVGAYRDGW